MFTCCCICRWLHHIYSLHLIPLYKVNSFKQFVQLCVAAVPLRKRTRSSVKHVFKSKSEMPAFSYAAVVRRMCLVYAQLCPDGVNKRNRPCFLICIKGWSAMKGLFSRNS